MSLKNTMCKSQTQQNTHRATTRRTFQNKTDLRRSLSGSRPWWKGEFRGNPLESRTWGLSSQRCSVSSLAKWEHSYVTIVRTDQFIHRRPVCFITGKLYLNEINCLKCKQNTSTKLLPHHPSLHPPDLTLGFFHSTYALGSCLAKLLVLSVSSCYGIIPTRAETFVPTAPRHPRHCAWAQRPRHTYLPNGFKNSIILLPEASPKLHFMWFLQPRKADIGPSPEKQSKGNMTRSGLE